VIGTVRSQELAVIAMEPGRKLRDIELRLLDLSRRELGDIIKIHGVQFRGAQTKDTVVQFTVFKKGLTVTELYDFYRRRYYQIPILCVGTGAKYRLVIDGCIFYRSHSIPQMGDEAGVVVRVSRVTVN
jgi:hypothetical protein